MDSEHQTTFPDVLDPRHCSFGFMRRAPLLRGNEVSPALKVVNVFNMASGVSLNHP